MTTSVFKDGHEVKVPDSQVEHMKRYGYEEKPAGKKSRKTPKTEEGSNDGEDQG